MGQFAAWAESKESNEDRMRRHFMAKRLRREP
jgi:hypothetical protein